MTKSYLFYFAQEHIQFRIPELKSIAATFDIVLDIHEQHDEQRPFLTVPLPDETCACRLTSRAVSVRSLFDLWAHAPSYDELFKKLKKIPKEHTKRFTDESQSFRIVVESFCRVRQQDEKINIIENILEHGIQFEGSVRLKNPDHTFYILEDHFPSGSAGPSKLYFGRWIMDGNREQINRFDLKKRKFIGNTSMEAGLSLRMANMAKVKPFSLVLDPFVGTGSLLVSSAHFGAYVMGAEIDHKLLHGRGKASRKGQKWRTREENIRNNLAQYGLEGQYVDVLVSDSSKVLWRKSNNEGLFDAIITDPPYGIRESHCKIESSDDQSSQGGEGKEATPRVVQYHISQVILDLLNFAARYLVVGGRLVYWYPAYKPEFLENCIPRHKCLTQVSCCEQTLSSKISRFLLTMEKHQQPQDEAEEKSGWIENDPFEKETFRDKYFSTTNHVIVDDSSRDSRQKEMTSKRTSDNT